MAQHAHVCAHSARDSLQHEVFFQDPDNILQNKEEFVRVRLCKLFHDPNEIADEELDKLVPNEEVRDVQFLRRLPRCHADIIRG